MQEAVSAEIAKRAYQMWEGEGRPHGRDIDHWLAAEREMQRVASATPTPKAARAKTGAARHATASAGKPKGARAGRS